RRSLSRAWERPACKLRAGELWRAGSGLNAEPIRRARRNWTAKNGDCPQFGSRAAPSRSSNAKLRGRLSDLLWLVTARKRRSNRATFGKRIKPACLSLTRARFQWRIAELNHALGTAFESWATGMQRLESASFGIAERTESLFQNEAM